MEHSVHLRYAVMLDEAYLDVLVGDCDMWSTWSEALDLKGFNDHFIDFMIFVFSVLFLTMLSYMLVLSSRTTSIGPITGKLPDKHHGYASLEASSSTTYLTAAGSGVAEVELVVRGFWIPGYFDLKTLVVKSLALILSASSGMSLGKEGPYVHLATCIFSIVTQICGCNQKYRQPEILRVGAASGLSVAFGAPVSGVVFALEELSYVTFGLGFICFNENSATSSSRQNSYRYSSVALYVNLFLKTMRWPALFNAC